MMNTTENQNGFFKIKDHLAFFNKTILPPIIALVVIFSLGLIVAYIKASGKNEIFKEYTPLQGQTFIVENGILDLIQYERELANNPMTCPVSDLYRPNSVLIKKVDDRFWEFTGIDEITSYYRDPDLTIHDMDKFNYKVFYTDYEDKKPVEAIVTYDMLIKYSYENQTGYELKLGKELIKTVFEKDKNKWMIDYFYIEAE